MPIQPTVSTRRFAIACLSTGAVAAIALPGNRIGLGMVLVAGLVLAAVALSGALKRSRDTAAGIRLAAALAAMAMVRDASWLVTFDLIAATAVLVLTAVGARSWRAMVNAVCVWTAELVPPALLRLPARERAQADPVVPGRGPSPCLQPRTGSSSPLRRRWMNMSIEPADAGRGAPEGQPPEAALGWADR